MALFEFLSFQNHQGPLVLPKYLFPGKCFQKKYHKVNSLVSQTEERADALRFRITLTPPWLLLIREKTCRLGYRPKGKWRPDEVVLSTQSVTNCTYKSHINIDSRPCLSQPSSPKAQKASVLTIIQTGLLEDNSYSNLI